MELLGLFFAFGTYSLARKEYLEIKKLLEEHPEASSLLREAGVTGAHLFWFIALRPYYIRYLRDTEGAECLTYICKKLCKKNFPALERN